MKRFYSHSFGCRVNQAEKEEIDRQLLHKGYIQDASKPDVFLINTCSVTHKAEREAKQLIYRVKRENPETKIVVTGCAATNWIKQGIQVKEADLVIDNKNKEYVAEIIQKHFSVITSDSEVISLSEKNKHNEIASPDSDRARNDIINDKYLNSGRIILKIQDGCHRFCSFCIVPYLRGLPKSMSIDQLISQINSVDPRIKEIILSAINTQAFGYDTKESFINLIERVLNETTRERISFGSIHPWSFTDEFFEFYKQYADSDRFVHFFHIPLQSGSNKMLALMKRGYTREEFMDKLQRISNLNPYAFIGTDVIVGYLEETDADFDDTYTFLEQTPISKFHVFRFSKRQHTAAYHMAKRLKEPTPQEKQKRAQALITLGKKKYQQFLQKHINQTFPALFLEEREGEYQQALLSNQLPILVSTDKDLRGTIHQVKVIESKNNSLIGKVI